jgi:t-SNARE complex subunit (syntaxin)
MPQSMEDISSNLSDSNSNILSLKDGIDEIAGSIANFQTDLSSAQGVINDYLKDLTDIQASLVNAQQKIFNWSIWIAIIFSILFVLIGVTQVATVLQGYEMMNYQKNLEKLIERKILELEAMKKLSILEKLD